MKSPGHQKWPEHRVEECKHIGHVKVEVNGEVVADSRNVLELTEDKHRVRYCFPREDVKMDRLQRTETTSECPFKGTARYFTLSVGDEQLQDAAWSYEQPYEEHQALHDRLAFYDDKYSAIHLLDASA